MQKRIEQIATIQPTICHRTIIFSCSNVGCFLSFSSCMYISMCSILFFVAINLSNWGPFFLTHMGQSQCKYTHSYFSFLFFFSFSFFLLIDVGYHLKKDPSNNLHVEHALNHRINSRVDVLAQLAPKSRFLCLLFGKITLTSSSSNQISLTSPLFFKKTLTSPHTTSV